MCLWAPAVPIFMPTSTWVGGSADYSLMRVSQCTCAPLFHGKGTSTRSSSFGMETALLDPFLLCLNSNSWNLHSKVPFLDIVIKKSTEGLFSSALFHKPTAGNTILHVSSAHQLPLIHFISYSQYLRLKGNCSDNDIFVLKAKKLQDHLLARGCSKKCLRKAYNRTKTQSCESLLFT